MMTQRFAWPLTAVACAVLLSACGGGSTSSTPPPVTGTGAQACSMSNPFRADAGGQYNASGVWTTVPTTVGSLSTEKAWLKSYMDGAYLWYNQIPAVNPDLPQYSNEAKFYTGNPSDPGSIDGYFAALKTTALTPSGAPLDRFSFTYPTKPWADLIGSGSSADNGIMWSVGSPTPLRNIRVAYVEPGSPAATAGVLRGDQMLSANGYGADDNTAAGIDALNKALSGGQVGQSNSYVFSRAGQPRPAVTLTSIQLTTDPVPLTQINVVSGKRIGYILFNAHSAASEGKLITAVNSLIAQGGVDDLVLDVRYNGGGYLYVASEMAYMIAGPDRTGGKVFERQQYNDKRTVDNAQAATPFFDTSCYLQGTACTNTTVSLPTLNLGRVTVLTTDNTCSASEAIVNGLRGINVTVNVVGGTTCGKPYGFTAKDNCGISYFPIEFKGVNNVGFGDYADGFAPTCGTADDLNQPLGSTAEGQYAMALGYLTTGQCTPVYGRAQPKAAGAVNAGGRILRGPERENRILVGERVR